MVRPPPFYMHTHSGVLPLSVVRVLCVHLFSISAFKAPTIHRIGLPTKLRQCERVSQGERCRLISVLARTRLGLCLNAFGYCLERVLHAEQTRFNPLLNAFKRQMRYTLCLTGTVLPQVQGRDISYSRRGRDGLDLQHKVWCRERGDIRKSNKPGERNQIKIVRATYKQSS